MSLIPPLQPLDPYKLAANAGVPLVVLVIILFFLVPKIDYGISVATRVDQSLTVIAARCGPGG